MTLLATEPSAIFTEFSQRALELNVPCWCCDREGEIIAHTHSCELAETLARSERFLAGLKAAVRDPSHPTAPAFFTNYRFLQQPDASATTVALILSSDPAEKSALTEFCAEAGIDQQAAEKMLTPLLRRDPDQIDPILSVLRHYHRDISIAADDRRLSDQFTRQLSQSYEVMNVLFRMGRCLNSSSDADVVTRNVCDELARVLPFSWVAIWFREGMQVLPELAGRLTSSGVLPCARDIDRTGPPPLLQILFAALDAHPSS